MNLDYKHKLSESKLSEVEEIHCIRSISSLLVNETALY